MKTTNNTVLITGGSAGIGLELAKLFTAKGNKVIITGRNAERLQKAAAGLPGVTALACDVTNAHDVEQLVKTLESDFPSLNIVINNAGQAHVYDVAADSQAADKAADEINTNYLSVIRLTSRLLPLVNRQPEAALVNVTSIVAFAPSGTLPTYSASKAALHSYSQSLRLTLAKSTNTKVFELMPPLVNTDFSKVIGGENGIPPAEVAEALLQGLETDTYEIHVAGTADLYRLFLNSPQQALEVMNASRA